MWGESGLQPEKDEILGCNLCTPPVCQPPQTLIQWSTWQIATNPRYGCLNPQRSRPSQGSNIVTDFV